MLTRVISPGVQTTFTPKLLPKRFLISFVDDLYSETVIHSPFMKSPRIVLDLDECLTLLSR